MVFYSSIALLAFLGIFRPYKDMQFNYNVFADEVHYLLILDLLLITTDILTIPDHKKKTGYLIIGLISLTILVSLTKLNVQNCRNCKLKCKQYRYKNSNDKKIKE